MSSFATNFHEFWWWMVLFVLLIGCEGTGGSEVGMLPTVLLTPTLVNVVPATPTSLPRPSAMPFVPDSGWEVLRPGLERRLISVQDDNGFVLDSLYVLRIDPAGYRFDIGYRPGEPLLLTEWQEETGALLVVNGGFFTEEYVATGLIMANGQASGRSYDGSAGMLSITPAGPDVRWLAEEPYDPTENLIGAIQAFPMLVKPGGVLGFERESNDAARRTVVGMDVPGRVLFILTQRNYFTLPKLSQYLVESDLNLDIALNLDGGTSSGLILAEPLEQIPSFALLPTVITLYPK